MGQGNNHQGSGVGFIFDANHGHLIAHGRSEVVVRQYDNIQKTYKAQGRLNEMRALAMFPDVELNDELIMLCIHNPSMLTQVLVDHGFALPINPNQFPESTATPA